MRIFREKISKKLIKFFVTSDFFLTNKSLYATLLFKKNR